MSEMKLTEFLELLKNADGNTGLSLVESYQAGGVQSLANHDADVIERMRCNSPEPDFNVTPPGIVML